MNGARLRVGVVGTYPPSRDGQAAFTRELTGALAEYLDVVVCAVDRHRYTYPDEVAAVVAESDVGDFRRAADILAEQAADAVLVLDQGWRGTHHLLDELRRDGIPCLVALPPLRASALAESVRADAPPDRAHPDAYRAMAALSAGAQRLLVRTQTAARVIEATVGTQLRVVPAGVPTAGPLTLVRPAVHQALAPTGLPAGRIISTVAPIRPGRGLEVAISGLPGLVAAQPDVRYLIAGPVGAEAEAYRDFLRDLVAELDLSGHVTFLDADLTLAESLFVLNRTLVHVVPRLDPERTCSATVARGLAAGCATVAGLHPYSAELLATGAGHLVRPGDPAALAAALGRLLADPDELAVARRVARSVGTGLRAPAVAQRIGELVREVARPRLDRVVTPPLRLPAGPVASIPSAVVGAGLLAVPVESLPEAGWSTAVGWVGAAVPRLTTLAEPTGRALWALSQVAASAGVPEAVRVRAAAARQAYARLLPDDLTDTAFAVLGLALDPDPAARLALRCAAGRLNAAWHAEDRGWPWFTDRVMPEGARLPQALIAAAVRLSDDGMLARGQEALEWYGRRIGLGAGGPRGTVAGADPAVETGAVIEAYTEAFRATGSVHYGRIAVRGLSWLPARPDSLAYLGAVLALRAVGLVELGAPVPVPLLAPAA